MSRLDQLYQDVILDHNKNPRNFKLLDHPGYKAHGKNPLCGDDYWVMIDLEDGVIKTVAFHGQGCAISKASGSMMSLALHNKTVEEALQLKEDFLTLTTQEHCPPDTKTALGRLSIFEGVKKFPVRVKCATLVWRALEKALTDNAQDTIVTTE